ncbi:aminoglycoside phosphotransferase family protein [Streptomyces sp. NBC_01390]|uniref:phosphotransferase family protein n=1 Tax=Streptomyces sp. NBC_01390 TaxID=2903850 RepID=UPI0032538A4F
MDPFVRIADRIEAARSVNANDQIWLLRRLDDLREAWRDLPPGLPQCVIHGDAWGGNVAVTANGDVLMDFERCAYGPPRMGFDVDCRSSGHLREGVGRCLCQVLRGVRP